jgi:hypothetical protein
MSMDICHRCDAPVDTDFDLDCYQPDQRDSMGHRDICICERCREHEAERDEIMNMGVIEKQNQFLMG